MLSRRRFLWTSMGCGAAAFGAWSFASPTLKRTVRSSHALGTKVTLTVLHRDEELANTAIDGALAEIDAVEYSLSLYRPNSDLCRLNRTGRLRDPDPRLVEVLRYAAEMSEQSGGAFDITVQPLWEAYDAAKRAGRLPSETEIAAAIAHVDWRCVETSDGEVRIANRHARLTLNGIAQGYAADRAGAVLRKHGIEHALLDTGELAGRGQNDNVPWRVGIQHPDDEQAFVALAQLENRALATSGDYSTTFSADRRYNHLLDPATGYSPGELASVSIAAPTAMEADALSTACFVLGAERALELLAYRTGCDAMFLTKQGRVLTTAGFPRVSEDLAHG